MLTKLCYKSIIENGIFISEEYTIFIKDFKECCITICGYASIANNHLDCLSKCAKTDSLLQYACYEKKYECVRYLLPKTMPNFISFVSDITCLKIARENGLVFCKKTAFLSIQSGNLESFKFINIIDEELLEFAAMYNNLDVIKYICSVYTPNWFVQIANAAAKYGNADCLKYIIDKGCPYTIETMRNATNNVECILFLHSIQCAWDESVCEAAVAHGNVQVLQVLHENGCPWDFRAVEAAETYGSDNCLEYMQKHGLI